MLPSVARYMERLPNGMDSFVSAQIKGGIVRAAVDRAHLGDSLHDEDAPPCVLSLARHPPPVSEWVSEVHYSALTAAIYDIRFRNAGGIAAYESWVFDGNLKLFRSPVYKVMIYVMGPARTFARATAGWTQFHRGSILSVVKADDKSSRLRLTYPPTLFADPLIRGFGQAFCAIAVAVGGLKAKVVCDTEVDGVTHYDVSWS